MSKVNSNQMSRISYNEDEKKLSIYSIGDAKQNESSLNLSNINWWGGVILESGTGAIARTAFEIEQQFDSVTRGEYDQYLRQCAFKAWEESCDTLRSACTFSRWIGWAYLKFVIKLIGKFNELLKLSDPQRALKDGKMPPEAFFAWKGIPSFEDQKISIANGDTTDKLQFSYNPQGGLTANIIDSQNNATPIKITTISSVKSDDTLFCLHTENGQEILVKKTDLLTIGLNLKGKVSLGQFFKDNGVPNFEDRAIIVGNGAAIKLSYDANSTSENDGISLYYFSNYTKVSIEPCLNGYVRLYGIRDGGNSSGCIAIFQVKDLQNFVNSLRTTENSNNSAQEGVPINQFFRDQDAVPFKGDYFYSTTIQNDDASQFDHISISSYGNNCVNLHIVDKNRSCFSTQNVRIKDSSNSDVVEISGQYGVFKNEENRKNFNIMVNRAELLRCKRGDKTAPNWPTKIEFKIFLRRNDALPSSEWQIRTLTATQLNGPNSEKNNQEVQIEINSSGDVHVGDDTLRYFDINIYRDESCKDGEAIIIAHKNNQQYKYKVKIDDLLGHSTSLKEKSLSKESNAQVSEDHASVADNKENKTNDTNSVPKSHKPKSGKKNNYNLENLPEKGVSFGDFLEGKDKIFTDQCSESFEATLKHSGHDDYSATLRFSRNDDTILLEEEIQGQWRKVSSSDQSFKLFPIKSDQDADKNKIKFCFGLDTNNRNRFYEVDKDTLQQILFPESNSTE